MKYFSGVKLLDKKRITTLLFAFGSKESMNFQIRLFTGQQLRTSNSLKFPTHLNNITIMQRWALHLLEILNSSLIYLKYPKKRTLMTSLQMQMEVLMGQKRLKMILQIQALMMKLRFLQRTLQNLID